LQLAGPVPIAFSSGASWAISTTQVGVLTIIHDYEPSADPNLFEVKVDITNNDVLDHSHLQYRRAMDWDINNAPEHSGIKDIADNYVTIGGVSPVPSALKLSNNNGFA